MPIVTNGECLYLILVNEKNDSQIVIGKVLHHGLVWPHFLRSIQSGKRHENIKALTLEGFVLLPNILLFTELRCCLAGLPSNTT